MKIILALVFMLSVVVTPLAMAGELGSADSNSSVATVSKLDSADSNFLFSNDQVSAAAITDQEMQDTQAKGTLIRVGNISVKDTNVCVLSFCK
jgi:hypothetical protein